MRKYHVMIFSVAIVCGSLLLYSGIKIQNSGQTGFGTILLGLAIGIMGLDDLVRRESVENHEDGSKSTYSGMSAVLLGFFWLIIAIVLALCGIVILLGQQDFIAHWLLEHPGAALLAIGGDAMTYAGNLLPGSQKECRSILTLLGSLPGRFVAFLLTLGGLFLVAAGMMEMMAPAYFDARMVDLSQWKLGIVCSINPVFCER